MKPAGYVLGDLKAGLLGQRSCARQAFRDATAHRWLYRLRIKRLLDTLHVT